MSIPDHEIEEPTRGYCPTHDLGYLGPVCPECGQDAEDLRAEWAYERAQLGRD